MPLHPTVPADGLRDIDAFARQHDLDLTLHRGFDGFAEYPIERGGHPVFAGFLPPRDGFWIAVTLHGKPFATYAAMPMDLVTNLTEHFAVDGLYPGNDRWLVETGDGRALADKITGTCMFGGGIIVDKPMRGSEVSCRMMTLLPLAGRLIGHALYRAEHFIYLQPVGRSFSDRTDRATFCPEAVRWWKNGVDTGTRHLGYASWEHVESALREFRATAPTP